MQLSSPSYRLSRFISLCWPQTVPHLVGMGFNRHNLRLGYKISLQHGSFTKSGHMPHFNYDYATFQAYWTALTNSAMTETGDQEAVQAMLELGRQVSVWMTLPPLARAHETDEAWMVAAHRIIDRLDRACHAADLTQLAIIGQDEEHHAKIRAASVLPARETRALYARETGGGFYSSGGGGGAQGGGAQRGFKRPRPSGGSGGGSLYCEYHKQCSHTTENCNVLKKQKTGK